jgi:hypothetical protein
MPNNRKPKRKTIDVNRLRVAYYRGESNREGAPKNIIQYSTPEQNSAFIKELGRIATKYGKTQEELLELMFYESASDEYTRGYQNSGNILVVNTKNPTSTGTGILQFTEATLSTLGEVDGVQYTTESLKEADPVVGLKYFDKFYEFWAKENNMEISDYTDIAMMHGVATAPAKFKNYKPGKDLVLAEKGTPEANLETGGISQAKELYNQSGDITLNKFYELHQINPNSVMPHASIAPIPGEIYEDKSTGNMMQIIQMPDGNEVPINVNIAELKQIGNNLYYHYNIGEGKKGADHWFKINSKYDESKVADADKRNIAHNGYFAYDTEDNVISLRDDDRFDTGYIDPYETDYIEVREKKGETKLVKGSDIHQIYKNEMKYYADKMEADGELSDNEMKKIKSMYRTYKKDVGSYVSSPEAKDFFNYVFDNVIYPDFKNEQKHRELFYANKLNQIDREIQALDPNDTTINPETGMTRYQEYERERNRLKKEREAGLKAFEELDRKMTEGIEREDMTQFVVGDGLEKEKQLRNLEHLELRQKMDAWKLRNKTIQNTPVYQTHLETTDRKRLERQKTWSGDKSGGASAGTSKTSGVPVYGPDNLVESGEVKKIETPVKQNLNDLEEDVNIDYLKSSIEADDRLLQLLNAQLDEANQPEDVEEEKFDWKSPLENISDLARFGAGIYGATRKIPEYKRGDMFTEYTEDARRMKDMGLTPLEISQRKQMAERAYAYDVANVKGLAGGSAGVALGNLGRAARGLQDRYAQIGVEDHMVRRENRQAFAQAAIQDEQINRRIFDDKLRQAMMNKTEGAALSRDAITNMRERAQFEESNKTFKEYYGALVKEKETSNELRRQGNIANIGRMIRETEENKIRKQNTINESTGQ